MTTAYKCTRANATDFHTGTFHYAPGVTLAQDGPADGAPCGQGLHVSPTTIQTCKYGNTSIDRGLWRWWEVEIDEADILGRDESKLRVRKLRVIREVTRAEVFGADIAQRIKEVNAEAATWKTIPWLKPPKPVTDEQIGKLLAEWHDAISPWRTGYCKIVTMPRVARRVSDRKIAVAATSTADDADATAATAADASTAADAASTAADAAFYGSWPYWSRWYVRPQYVLWRWARRHICYGDSKPNPWRPLMEMFKLGCVPIGYATVPGDPTVAFTVYCGPVTR